MRFAQLIRSAKNTGKTRINEVFQQLKQRTKGSGNCEA